MRYCLSPALHVIVKAGRLGPSFERCLRIKHIQWEFAGQRFYTFHYQTTDTPSLCCVKLDSLVEPLHSPIIHSTNWDIEPPWGRLRSHHTTHSGIRVSHIDLVLPSI